MFGNYMQYTVVGRAQPVSDSALVKLPQKGKIITSKKARRYFDLVALKVVDALFNNQNKIYNFLPCVFEIKNRDGILEFFSISFNANLSVRGFRRLDPNTQAEVLFRDLDLLRRNSAARVVATCKKIESALGIQEGSGLQEIENNKKKRRKRQTDAGVALIQKIKQEYPCKLYSLMALVCEADTSNRMKGSWEIIHPSTGINYHLSDFYGIGTDKLLEILLRELNFLKRRRVAKYCEISLKIRAKYMAWMNRRVSKSQNLRQEPLSIPQLFTYRKINLSKIVFYAFDAWDKVEIEQLVAAWGRPGLLKHLNPEAYYKIGLTLILVDRFFLKFPLVEREEFYTMVTICALFVADSYIEEDDIVLPVFLKIFFKVEHEGDEFIKGEEFIKRVLTFMDIMNWDLNIPLSEIEKSAYLMSTHPVFTIVEDQDAAAGS